MSAVTAIAVFAPAKINLMLAITDRREDGFHNLVSVVTPLGFGDSLWFQPLPERLGFRLECAQSEVPLDESNLILRAAKMYAEESGMKGGGRFVLTKRIPMGAGLGGGSSDASAALLALDSANGQVLGRRRLTELSAQIGSDCPLFVASRPVVMRGRGERLEFLQDEAVQRMSGRRLLLFKPSFGISTPWAYQQMAKVAPRMYLPSGEAEVRLTGWLGEPDKPLEDLLYNNMEDVAFAKYQALPALVEQLWVRHGLQARMSGSGSCCFALLTEGFEARPVERMIREFWGDDVFVMETRIL